MVSTLIPSRINLPKGRVDLQETFHKVIHDFPMLSHIRERIGEKKHSCNQCGKYMIKEQKQMERKILTIMTNCRNFLNQVLVMMRK